MHTNADNRYGSLSAWAYDLDKPAMALTAAGVEAPVISGGFEHGRPPRSGDNVISFEAERR